MAGSYKHRGVTLVELLVALAVLAILLSMALPSFESTLRSNRLAVATNELTSGLALARSEAIRNGRGSQICASADGLSCDAGNDWNEGWLIWSDANGNGELDAAEVVQVSQAKAKMLITGPVAPMSFDGRGRLGTGGQFSLQPDECGERAMRRLLHVNLSGQVRKDEQLEACA